MFNRNNNDHRPIIGAVGAEQFHYGGYPGGGYPGGPGYPGGGYPGGGYPGGPGYPGGGYDSSNYISMLERQIQENERRIRNLNRRLNRVENYLGIRSEEDVDSENSND